MLSLHFTFLLTISSVALTSALPSALDFTPAGIHNPHLSRRALIDVNALAGVLAPSDCGAGSVVGVQAGLAVGNLLAVCVCVNVIGGDSSDSTACPACPANASPVCDPNAATPCNCACDSPYVDDGNGQCILPPSAAAGRKRSRGPAIALDDSPIGSRAYSAARCPNMETACPISKSSKGWECLDTRSALDSCGGCLSAGGINCLNIPGVMGVGCVDSTCEVSSCMPGWHMVQEHCVKST